MVAESIGFNQIAELIEFCMDTIESEPLVSTDTVLDVDKKTRYLALSWIDSHKLSA